MMNIKSYTAIFFGALLLLSCDDNKESENITMELVDIVMYLKADPETDSVLPPIAYFMFDVNNNSTRKKVFIAKGNKFDGNKSEIMLLDTVQNKIISIYSESVIVLLPKQHRKISAYVNLKDIAVNLGINSSFLNESNILHNKKLINDKLYDIINRSLIIYNQKTEEAVNQKILDNEVEPFEQDLIKISVSKDLKIK